MSVFRIHLDANKKA
ncbi:hypothetical protein [Escherichia coli]